MILSKNTVLTCINCISTLTIDGVLNSQNISEFRSHSMQIFHRLLTDIGLGTGRCLTCAVRFVSLAPRSHFRLTCFTYALEFASPAPPRTSHPDWVGREGWVMLGGEHVLVLWTELFMCVCGWDVAVRALQRSDWERASTAKRCGVCGVPSRLRPVVWTSAKLSTQKTKTNPLLILFARCLRLLVLTWDSYAVHFFKFERQPTFHECLCFLKRWGTASTNGEVPLSGWQPPTRHHCHLLP